MSNDESQSDFHKHVIMPVENAGPDGVFKVKWYNESGAVIDATPENPNSYPQNVPMEAPPGLKELTYQAAFLKNAIIDLEIQLEVQKEKFKTISDTLLKTLDLMDLDSVRGHGYLFFKERKSSVTTPKTTEEKKELFDFLEQKGIFLEMVSINSMTLNSLYKSLAADAAKMGVLDFKMPGVGEPQEYVSLKLRKG